MADAKTLQRSDSSSSETSTGASSQTHSRSASNSSDHSEQQATGASPQVRSFAARKTVYQSKMTYKELVAEKQEQQKKKEQVMDMTHWGRPKDTEIIKDATFELAGFAKDWSAKKMWDKRWLALTTTALYFFKNKKSDAPLGVIMLSGCKVDEFKDERTKKFAIRIAAPLSYSQDAILKDHYYVLIPDVESDAEVWRELLRHTVDVANTKVEQEQMLRSGGTSTEATSPATSPVTSPETRPRGDSWFNHTQTSRALTPSQDDVTKERSKDTKEKDKEKEKEEEVAHRRESISEKTKRSSLTMKLGKKMSGDLQKKHVSVKFADQVGSPSRSPVIGEVGLIPQFQKKVEVKPTKPTIYFHPFIPHAAAVFLLCEEHKLDVDKSFVHFTWLMNSYTSPEVRKEKEEHHQQQLQQQQQQKLLELQEQLNKESHIKDGNLSSSNDSVKTTDSPVPSRSGTSTPSGGGSKIRSSRMLAPTKKTAFKPRFLVLNGEATVPFMVDEKQETMINKGAGILKYLQERYKLNDSYYPAQEQKKREKIDEIMDTWGLSTHVIDSLKHGVFDKLLYANCQPRTYQTQQTLKELNRILGRMDTELKNHAFLAGDVLTFADVQVACEVLILQLLVKFDFTKLPNIKKWMSEMEKAMKTGWTALTALYDELVKEHLTPKPVTV